MSLTLHDFELDDLGGRPVREEREEVDRHRGARDVREGALAGDRGREPAKPQAFPEGCQVEAFDRQADPGRGRGRAESARQELSLDPGDLEQRQQDEAGAALIKAVGLYPPGTFVRLVNGEEGIVVKRGTSATEPLVAALLGKSGNPLTEPVPRDTRLASQAVSQGLAPHELRLRLSVEKLLRLSAA